MAREHRLAKQAAKNGTLKKAVAARVSGWNSGRMRVAFIARENTIVNLMSSVPHEARI